MAPAMSSTWPLGRSGLGLARGTTRPLTASTVSLPMHLSTSGLANVSLTTICSIPSRSRRSMKVRPPSSRMLFTQP